MGMFSSNQTEVKAPRILLPHDPIERQVEVLNDLIIKPPQGSRVLPITPDLARHIMENRNPLNRNRSERKLAIYAADMRAGRWTLTNASLAFTREGELSDGQHRLVACIRAGVLFQTHVVFGLTHDALINIDQGKPRNATNVFYVNGKPSPELTSAATRWALICANDPTDRAAHFEPRELLAAFEGLEPQGFVIFVQTTAAAINTPDKLFPLAAVSALCWELTKHHPKAVSALVQDINQNRIKPARGKRATKAGSLMDYLELLRSLQKGRVHENIRHAAIINCWRAYVNGWPKITAKQLAWNPATDAFPSFKVG